jgi:hypothetical protein
VICGPEHLNGLFGWSQAINRRLGDSVQTLRAERAGDIGQHEVIVPGQIDQIR